MGEPGEAPASVGIRAKSLEAPTRRRGVRSLDLFLGALGTEGPRRAIVTLRSTVLIARWALALIASRPSRFVVAAAAVRARLVASRWTIFACTHGRRLAIGGARALLVGFVATLVNACVASALL